MNHQMQTGSDGTMTPPEKPDGDSYVTSLTNNTNGHTLYVNGVAYKG